MEPGSLMSRHESEDIYHGASEQEVECTDQWSIRWTDSTTMEGRSFWVENTEICSRSSDADCGAGLRIIDST